MSTRSGIWIVCTSLLWAVACGPWGEDAGPRFVALGPAVVRDARSGLEWTRRADGAGLAWHDAEAYCRSLSIDDARGWRLPTIDELRGLYDAPARTACGDATCAIDAVFHLGSPWVWSATARGVHARFYLDFKVGTELSPTITPRLRRSVLCVRSPGGAVTPAGASRPGR